jgi:hypothetical protein
MKTNQLAARRALTRGVTGLLLSGVFTFHAHSHTWTRPEPMSSSRQLVHCI